MINAGENAKMVVIVKSAFTFKKLANFKKYKRDKKVKNDNQMCIDISLLLK